MQVFGDEQLAREVMAFLQEWDNAIARLDIQDIVQLCRPEIRLVDVSMEVKGVEAYQALWQQYLSFMPEGIRIESQNINIHVTSDLAVVDGYVRVNYAVIEPIFQLGWCRVSMCLSKQQGKWQLLHQHTSVPVQLETRKMRRMKSVS
ncbi:YybH family protein [Acinetobacter lwoffii]|uniref:YybH family protein n=1 Tax=Acinetobacter lwoffii TaxID=28090 RepID=UPI00209AE125|nr:nuclear transport factor 2 family protein [Acinetobacter lwoffii]MCO8079642.1 nuclear transport factor 2 family protein [Acinetobacter lwoffii]